MRAVHFIMEAIIKRPPRTVHFVGIDISKNELDFAIIREGKLLLHRECINDKSHINKLISELKRLPKFRVSTAVFCMEATGCYGQHVVDCLMKLKAKIIVDSALRIKRSLGLVRGKDDKVDAIRIAHYASRHQHELRTLSPKRPIIEQLAELQSLRTKLHVISAGLGTRLSEKSLFLRKTIHTLGSELCAQTTIAIKRDIEEIVDRMDTLLKADTAAKHLYDLICSVPGVGSITAINILVCTNEFKDISSPKKFACYAGVAPFKNESGKFIRRAKVSKLANRRMKSLLHLCALSAIRSNEELKLYYQRKLAEGKNKMAVINAIRNKLVLRIFACVNRDRLFEDSIQQVN